VYYYTRYTFAGKAEADGRANGLRISRRERAAYDSAKMRAILRAAVGLHERVGRA